VIIVGDLCNKGPEIVALYPAVWEAFNFKLDTSWSLPPDGWSFVKIFPKIFGFTIQTKWSLPVEIQPRPCKEESSVDTMTGGRMESERGYIV
jgi:hypothetical protein